MAGKLTVVLSQGQSQAPDKRGLEEDLVAALVMERGVEVSVIPHLYDLTDGHTGLLYLRAVKGDMVVLSWSYPRAAHWVLDRFGVRGKIGTVLLKSEAGEGEEESEAEQVEAARGGVGALDVPERFLYCIDLRDAHSAETYLDEIRRIAAESAVETVPLMPVLSAPAATVAPVNGNGAKKFTDDTPRRWYPVIDYDRCTNCMECIDFCLFGVYGIDGAERILVENQDNCKKGCPACSRVCPENAIIFPQHKTPAIAGALVDGPSGLKIDLSRLFGAPSAIELAAQERDVELVRDGREAVGLSVGIPKRQAGRPAGPKDDLDLLMDSLDELAI